jgi:hypothetical protein
MAGATIGFIDDASAIYFNPAGIAQGQGLEFMIGASPIIPSCIGLSVGIVGSPRESRWLAARDAAVEAEESADSAEERFVAGLEAVHDLPGVGENLQDHLEVYIQYACKQPVSVAPYMQWRRRPLVGLQWLFLRSGPGATNHFEAGGFFIRDDARVVNQHVDLIGEGSEPFCELLDAGGLAYIQRVDMRDPYTVDVVTSKPSAALLTNLSRLFILPRGVREKMGAEAFGQLVRRYEPAIRRAVRFRLANVGTWSWYWGVDNFGLYSIPAGAAPLLAGGPTPAAQTSAVGNAASITIADAIGLGPIFSYSKKVGERQLDMNGRWVHEFDASTQEPSERQGGTWL